MVMPSLPAGKTGFELMIWVSRNGASTDRLGGPPVTVVLLKADISAMSGTHWKDPADVWHVVLYNGSSGR